MYYEYSVVNGVLRLKGSDNVALCRGFYDYVKTYKLGMYSWSGNNIQLPSSIFVFTTDYYSIFYR